MKGLVISLPIGIIQQAAQLTVCESICSFCSRMKRGRLYACARREGYNVLAMGQHLDDLAERYAGRGETLGTRCTSVARRTPDRKIGGSAVPAQALGIHQCSVSLDSKLFSIPFLSPEPTILLVSTKDRDLWSSPTPEVRDSRIHCQI